MVIGAAALHLFLIYSLAKDGFLSFPVTETGLQIALDSQGNCYVAGVFSGETDFDTSPATDIRVSAYDTDFFLSKYDADGNYMWTYTWEGPKYIETVFDVFVDSTDSVYIGGRYSPVGENGQNIFIDKLDPDGNLSWSNDWSNLNPRGGFRLYQITENAAGNVVLTGKVSEMQVDLNPDPQEEFNVGEWDLFIAEFDYDGNFLDAEPLDLNPNKIRIDDNGNICAIYRERHGYYRLSTYDPDGDFQWSYSWRAYGLYNWYSNYVTVDSSGNVYIAATSTGENPEIYEQHLSSEDDEILLVKLNPDGNVLWSDIWGGDGEDYPDGLALDGDGNIYVAGTFMKPVDLESGLGLSDSQDANLMVVFLYKYNPDGSLVWTRTWDGDSPKSVDEYADIIAIDNDGNIFITGAFTGPVDFDPGPGVTEHESLGEYDIFLSKFDPDGNLLWTRTWGGQNAYAPF